MMLLSSLASVGTVVMASPTVCQVLLYVLHLTVCVGSGNVVRKQALFSCVFQMNLQGFRLLCLAQLV